MKAFFQIVLIVMVLLLMIAVVVGGGNNDKAFGTGGLFLLFAMFWGIPLVAIVSLFYFILKVLKSRGLNERT